MADIKNYPVAFGPGHSVAQVVGIPRLALTDIQRATWLRSGTAAE
jgi:hypothetical protein